MSIASCIENRKDKCPRSLGVRQVTCAASCGQQKLNKKTLAGYINISYDKIPVLLSTVIRYMVIIFTPFRE